MEILGCLVCFYLIYKFYYEFFSINCIFNKHAKQDDLTPINASYNFS